MGSVDAKPESSMILTMLETVAVDRPVCRASSACVEGPAISVSMMRCWFSCLRADWEPGFFGLLLVERVVAGMLRRLPHSARCSQEVNAMKRFRHSGRAGMICLGKGAKRCKWPQEELPGTG